jgi:translation initiation factor 1A
MPKNKIGGKGHKKQKNSKEDDTVARNLVFSEENSNTDYAYVQDILGGGNMRVVCYRDRKVRVAHIRGNMYKKVWIGKDDVILVSLRDFQDAKCDIILKYLPSEVKTLLQYGQIDNSFLSIGTAINMTAQSAIELDENITFEVEFI